MALNLGQHARLQDEARYSWLCCSGLCLTAIALAVSAALADSRDTRAWKEAVGERGCSTRHAFSFLIWDLNCVWHMQVGFECFLMTYKRTPLFPDFTTWREKEISQTA